MDTRIAAYGIITEGSRILLAHWNYRGYSGWTLPGGGIDPGEDPADAAVREIFEETGFHARIDSLIGIDSHVIPTEHRFEADEPVPQHSLRIIYRASITGGTLTYERDGSTDWACWYELDQLDELKTVGLVPIALKLWRDAGGE